MKTTLEEINIRINETEEQIHELEDRMMEITANEQKRKNEKKKGPFTRHLGQQMYQHLYYRDCKRRREKKGLRKYLKR